MTRKEFITELVRTAYEHYMEHEEEYSSCGVEFNDKFLSFVFDILKVKTDGINLEEVIKEVKEPCVRGPQL